MRSKSMAVGKVVCAALVVVGVAVCTYGLWMAWEPLGFIFGGAVLAAGAFLCAYDVEDVRRMR